MDLGERELSGSLQLVIELAGPSAAFFYFPLVLSRRSRGAVDLLSGPACCHIYNRPHKPGKHFVGRRPSETPKNPAKLRSWPV
jgi:hypothetical protein